jgi:ApaG protein
LIGIDSCSILDLAYQNEIGMSTYTATTSGITITAHPVYLDGQSDFVKKKFVFAYFIRITNNSDEAVQLLRRHWVIVDANSDVKHVEGEGVVGQQPVIAPGSFHDYNSFSVLETFEGTMEGTYLLRKTSGEEFHATIPRFFLRAASN